MKRINENEFTAFLIVGQGWSCNFATMGAALREWNKLQCAGTLYGIKANGDQALLDSTM